MGYSQPSKVNRLLKRENFDKALEYGQSKISTLSTEAPESRQILKYYLAISKVHSLKNDLSKAEEVLTTALKIVNQRLELDKWCTIDDYNILDELSLIRLKSGNYIAAKKLIDRSLKLRSNRWDKNNPTNFRPYYTLGLYYYRTNQIDSALHYLSTYQKNIRNSNYTGSLEINRYADNYELLSEIELERGHIFKALTYAKKNKRLQKHSWTKIQSGKNTRKIILANEKLASIYIILNDLKKASKLNKLSTKKINNNFPNDDYLSYKSALNSALIDYAKDSLNSCLNNLHKVPPLIWNYIQTGLGPLSEYEKENFLQIVRSDIDLLESILFTLMDRTSLSCDDHEQLTEILEFIINTRALVLDQTSKMLHQFNESNSDSTKSTFLRWKKIKNEIAYYHSRKKSKHEDGKVVELHNELNLIEKQLSKTEFKLSHDTIIKLIDMQKALDSNSIAIQVIRSKKYGTKNNSNKRNKPWWYFHKIKHLNILSDSLYYSFLILNKDSIEIKTIVLTPEKEEKILLNYFNCINYKIPDRKTFGYTLSEIKFPEDSSTKIYFAPEGVFNLINLNALFTNEEKYLIDQYHFINLTSLKDLIRQPDSSEFTNALLLGNPSFSTNSNWQQLPGAEQEVITIHESLETRNIKSKILTGKSATETALKISGNYNILHIATHGYFQNNNSRSPMFNSGLVLATNDSLNDGTLSAYELATISLKETKLAVLSACETGLGELKGGEGIYGLQRSLQLAGVDYIVMSFWQVDDTATQQLMVSFYKNLLIYKDPKLAFLKAQLHLKSIYSDPFYWASFKIVGK